MDRALFLLAILGSLLALFFLFFVPCPDFDGYLSPGSCVRLQGAVVRARRVNGYCLFDLNAAGRVVRVFSRGSCPSGAACVVGRVSDYRGSVEVVLGRYC